jgi:hypothetical protein
VTGRPFDRDSALRTWSEGEHRSALSSADHSVIDATYAIRETIVDFALRPDRDEELYDACAVLGRVLANAGASASLAATSIDHACEAMGERTPPWSIPARAAMAEGFARAMADTIRGDGHASWDFPASAVRLDETTIAIAAGHPSDDEEILAAWAGRAARAAACDGIRRAIISGPDRPRAALAEALAIVGIDCSER